MTEIGTFMWTFKCLPTRFFFLQENNEHMLAHFFALILAAHDYDASAELFFVRFRILLLLFIASVTGAVNLVRRCGRFSTVVCAPRSFESLLMCDVSLIVPTSGTNLLPCTSGLLFEIGLRSCRSLPMPRDFGVR